MSLPSSCKPSQRATWRGTLAALALLAGPACVKTLPAAAPPQPLMPSLDVPAAPAPGGQGRLVIDVVDGPTPIHRVHMDATPTDDGQGRVAHRFFARPELMCTTSPCVAELPIGNVLIGFPVRGDARAMESELVHVGPNLTVYRRSLSQYDGRTGATRVLGIIASSIGSCAAITGIALLPVGLGKDNDTLAGAGGITLGVGAALVALGIWAIRSDSPWYRAGASVHFSPSVSAPGSAD